MPTFFGGYAYVKVITYSFSTSDKNLIPVKRTLLNKSRDFTRVRLKYIIFKQRYTFNRVYIY